MSMDVAIVDGPLGAADDACDACRGVDDRAGARVVFEGVVRAIEGGRPLIALEYQTYEPMAQDQLRDLAADVIAKHGLLGVVVRHSRGRVPVGAVSFRMTVFAPHRKEALAAMDEFIDRMKRDVPIWKSPVFADGGERGPVTRP
jgi:molybdopterin synthase catalytic subunit